MPEGGQNLGVYGEKQQRKGHNEVGLQTHVPSKSILSLVYIQQRRKHGDLWSVTVLLHIITFSYPI